MLAIFQLSGSRRRAHAGGPASNGNRRQAVVDSLSHTLGKLIVTAALALVVAGGAAAVAAESAAAAATTYTQYCFRHTSGAAWTGRPVYAQAYYNGRWYDIGSSTSNINGCGAFAMPTNTYVRVRAYLRLSNYVYGGVTDWALTPSYGGSVNLGTGWVNS